MYFFYVVFIVHVVFLLVIFDIYFRTPISIGITPIQNKVPAKAKRLVLFSGDGVRADYFFEHSKNETLVPFLRNIVEKEGRWGVSHTRVPTESRPGHVALIAGFYEDPSAVFKGWQENPVLFDSVFNESLATFSWGSPDIVPLFSKGPETSHIHYASYSKDMENFSGKYSSAIKLNDWVLDEFIAFIKNTEQNATLLNLLHSSKIVFFFHLLTTDVIGHSSKPKSSEYSAAITTVDLIVQKIVGIFEETFDDNSTAYIFSSDHGMTDWGSHGAGSRSETETPLVVWGAGVPNPGVSVVPKDTPESWQLSRLERNDVNQADIAVLMSVLLGIPIPVHSVGVLPVGYVSMEGKELAESLKLNADQLLAQLNFKAGEVEEQLILTSFKPFPGLSPAEQGQMNLAIEKAIQHSQYQLANNMSHSLIKLSISGINYYHNYFQQFLLIMTTLSFFGLMANIFGRIVDDWKTEKNDVKKAAMSRFITCLMIFLVIFVTAWTYVYLQKFTALPPLFSVYVYMPVTLWVAFLWRYPWILSWLIVNVNGTSLKLSAFYIFGLEAMVLSFFHRWSLSLVLILMSQWPKIDPSVSGINSSNEKFWTYSCLVLTIFPVLPTVERAFQIWFIVLAGTLWFVFAVLLTFAPKMKIFSLNNAVTWTQNILCSVTIWNVLAISSSFKLGEGLPLPNQIVSYLLLVSFMVLMLLGSDTVVSKFLNMSYSVGLSFLLFCSSFEAFYPLALSAHLLAWIFIERDIKSYIPIVPRFQGDFRKSSAAKSSDKVGDFRRSFFFVFYIFLSFFGIGNIASINSFDTNWVRCFVTTFSPFYMTILILFKTFMPLLLVGFAFRFIIMVTKTNWWSQFLIVLFFCDVMSFHFLFLVRNTGSWLEIGTSISHFVIMNSVVLFLLIIYKISQGIIRSNLSWHRDKYD